MDLSWKSIVLFYLVGVIPAWLGMGVATMLYARKYNNSEIDKKWILKTGLLSWIMAFISILLIIDTCKAKKNINPDS